MTPILVCCEDSDLVPRLSGRSEEADDKETISLLAKKISSVCESYKTYLKKDGRRHGEINPSIWFISILRKMRAHNEDVIECVKNIRKMVLDLSSSESNENESKLKESELLLASLLVKEAGEKWPKMLMARFSEEEGEEMKDLLYSEADAFGRWSVILLDEH